MPKSVLDPKFKVKRLRSEIVDRRKDLGITQKMMADELKISQPAYSIREKNGDFSFNQLTSVFKALKFTDEEIAKLFK